MKWFLVQDKELLAYGYCIHVCTPIYTHNIVKKEDQKAFLLLKTRETDSNQAPSPHLGECDRWWHDRHWKPTLPYLAKPSFHFERIRYPDFNFERPYCNTDVNTLVHLSLTRFDYLNSSYLSPSKAFVAAESAQVVSNRRVNQYPKISLAQLPQATQFTLVHSDSEI